MSRPTSYEAPAIARRTAVGPELIGLGAGAPSDPPTMLFSEG